VAKAKQEIPVHYDFLQRPLAIGDSVIMIKSGYRELQLVRVEKFTPKKIYVRWGEGPYAGMYQESNQVCKIDGPELTAYLLKR
jgi:hypothetical protein